MHLKQLHLQGFKTFANKTGFAFAPGITAVVGPNGSGKSNVADGLRWVLGEQSYLSLRGRKTEDVIFSGSSKRAPTGFAEVSLTLDNSGGLLPIDYAEVTITRRAHRSGENEYFINKNRVRLRDLVELTAGLNRLYTVVGQGLVDTALSQRPEERRALFEAAAGISHFYTQKDEAERRLKATEENMTRLGDLLSEAGPRLRLLERQARQARDACTVEADLHARLRLWYSHQLAATTARLQHAEAEAAQMIAARTTAASVLTEAQTAEATASQQVATARTALQRAEAQAAALQGQVATLEREVAVAAVNLAASHRQLAEQERTAADAAAQATARLTAARQLERELVAGSERLTTTRRELAAAEAAGAAAADEERVLAAHVEQAQRTHTAASAALAASRRAAADAERSVERAAAEAAAAEAALPPLQAKLTQAEAAAQEAATAVAAQASQLTSLQAERSAAETSLADLQSRLRAAEAASLPLRAAEQKLLARLDALQRLANSGAGLYGGVRSVLDAGQGGKLRGIVGTVASLLHVPAKLELAIETALGSHLQDIVVEDWPAAEAAIALLKRTNVGRATFLPLDIIKPSPYKGEGWVRVTGIVGIAADLVDHDPRFINIVSSLLGRTLVVDDLAVARRIVQDGGGWTLVTREGEIVRPGGAVTGGSKGKDSGLLARERDLRELPGSIEAARVKLKTAQANTASLEAERRKLTAQLEQHARQLAEASRQQQAAEGRAAAASRELERSRQELTYRRAAANELATRARQLAASLPTAAAEQERQQTALLTAADALTAATAELGRWRESRSTAISQLATLRAEVRGGQDNLRRQQATLEQSHREADLLQAAARDLAARHAALAADLSQAKAMQQQAERQLQTLRSELTAAGEAAAPLRQRLVEGEAGVRAAARTISQRQGELLAAEQQLGRGELAVERARLEVDDLCTRARTELGDDFQPDLHPDALPDKLAAEIAALRQRIVRLGAINPLAVEEYEEEAGRQQFLTTQVADLQAAAATLRQVIAELEATMQQRFNTTFAAVAANFSSYFTRLFGGGAARLEMSSEAGGVEIVAQPPGKRWQPLGSLSGGERALTAVALLFSLLSVNPAPFCLLDEVDAALDEANIGRFTAALAELSSKTQFIVITHNRATIAAAGAVYGIALGDDHTSRALSVSLAQVA